MANHQHALVRYATLDRCFARLKLDKNELIGRCSEAVNRLTGKDGLLSEKTFYNDVRAMREGVVLGREAPIECENGVYWYSVPGFSLFKENNVEVELQQALHQLEGMKKRLERACLLLESLDITERRKNDLRALLLDDDGFTWVGASEHQVRQEQERQRKMTLISDRDIRFSKASSIRVEPIPKPISWPFPHSTSVHTQAPDPSYERFMLYLIGQTQEPEGLQGALDVSTNDVGLIRGLLSNMNFG